MSRDVVILNGSPSPSSRSTFIAGAVAARAQAAGLRPVVFSLRDFDPADALFARSDGASIARFVEATRSAAAIVLSTPVYKAAYSGALKAIVDLVPPDALVGRVALGIATGRLPAHGVEVDRAFRSLFAFFRARVLETLFVLDDHVGSGEHRSLTVEAEERVQAGARRLVAAIEAGAAEAPQP